MTLSVVFLLTTSLDKLVMMDIQELKNKLLLRKSWNRKIKKNLQKKTLITQIFKKNKNSISLQKKTLSTIVMLLNCTSIKASKKSDKNSLTSNKIKWQSILHSNFSTNLIIYYKL